MANTTVVGAQAIHGQNPQVRKACRIELCFLIYLVLSRNSHPKSNLWIYFLEGALFCSDGSVVSTEPLEEKLIYFHSWISHWQSHWSSLYWRSLWQPKAHWISMLIVETSANPARERDTCRVPLRRGVQVRLRIHAEHDADILLQVSTRSCSTIYPDDVPSCGCVWTTGTPTQRLSKAQVEEYG